eukprot:TRINITY_DN14170_c0_g1_i1.p1 TRINITY_DN14170_c0_g1~~TRINITY_DN14170_c0_g1_i1.p1  ORF type:complete len:125 (+),score=43.84 TRINITY_DN14170_c0_g1_i1:172-546(+)
MWDLFKIIQSGLVITLVLNTFLLIFCGTKAPEGIYDSNEFWRNGIILSSSFLFFEMIAITFGVIYFISTGRYAIRYTNTAELESFISHGGEEQRFNMRRSIADTFNRNLSPEGSPLLYDQLPSG